MSDIEQEKTSWRPAIVIGLVLFGLWLVSPWLIRKIVGSSDYALLGAFGDTFGAINALFSGLAFTGLFYAILLQRRELELQRRELAATRAVLQSQKEESEKQNATLQQQTFDNTFFQLLRQHNEIVQAIDIRNGGQLVSQGRDCFKSFLRKFHHAWGVSMNDYRDMSLEERVDSVYLKIYSEIESDVGHYFRNLYNLVKFVDNSNIVDKRRYTNLIRAQLSSNELLLLFYNGVSPLGKQKFKPLIERYSLLKTVPAKELLDQQPLMQLYDSSAFR